MRKSQHNEYKPTSQPPNNTGPGAHDQTHISFDKDRRNDFSNKQNDLNRSTTDEFKKNKTFTQQNSRFKLEVTNTQLSGNKLTKAVIPANKTTHQLELENLNQSKGKEDELK